MSRTGQDGCKLSSVLDVQEGIPSGRFEIEGAAGRGQQVSPGHDREGFVQSGILVSTAADGEEALRIAKEQLPDIVLLDMMIPKLAAPMCSRR